MCTRHIHVIIYIYICKYVCVYIMLLYLQLDPKRAKGSIIYFISTYKSIHKILKGNLETGSWWAEHREQDQ